MNKSKKAKIIIYCIAALFAISIVVLLSYASPTVPIAFGRDYPFEETYNLYQEYADTYVKTWNKDLIEDDSINIITDINENFIIVVVDGTVANVEARYPIGIVNEADKKDTNFIISSDDGNYKNYSDVESKLFYSALLLVEFILWFIVFYMINNGIYKIINYIVAKIKKKKYK